jgi:hypothetical protein
MDIYIEIILSGCGVTTITKPLPSENPSGDFEKSPQIEKI